MWTEALFFCRARIMDYQKKQRTIDLVLWGKVATEVNGVDFIFNIPTAEIKAKSTLEYDKALLEAKSSNLLTEEEALEVGNWDYEDEGEIASIRRDIENIRRGLLDFQFHKIKLEKARQLLKAAEKALVEKISEKFGLLTETDENYALLRQQRFIISKITRLEDDKLFWPTMKSFDDDTNIGLISILCSDFFNGSIISDINFRLIARSEPWRTTWSYFKKGGALFGADLSRNQDRLVYWSNVYDSVYEAYERPSQQIIEDNDLLDSWFMHEAEKVSRQQREKMIDKKFGKNTKGGKQELFVMTDKQGAKDIHDLNTRHSKIIAKNRQTVIDKQGKIDEQDLPDSQLALRQQAIKQTKDRMKSISNRR